VENPNWPLSLKRNHPIIAGVGLGNAMADHVSMLLADRVFLEETDVNPKFLDVRDRVRPEGMRLFIRGPPHKLAADTKVLKELLGIMADSRVECIADFNSAVDKTLFSEEELELHELFEPLLNRSRISPTTAYDEDKEAGDEALLSARGLSAKRLFFHFGTTIDDVEVPLPNGNKRLSVTNHAGSKMSFRASDVITAMGFSAPETSWVADAIDDLVLDGEHKPVVMSCGWASGKGGNLGKVKESAKVVAEDIHRAVRAGRFDNGAAHYDQARLPLRGHLAQAEANALSYLLEGNRIHDRDTHAVAQQYSERVNMFEDEEDTGAVAAPAAAAAAPEAVPDGAIGITKSDGSSEFLTELGGADDMAHHLLMEKGFMAPVECDGDGVCLKCVCVVTGPAVEHDGEENAILSANGLKPNAKDGSQHILACMHQASSLKGRQILAKFP
jgi:ferredoxin